MEDLYERVRRVLDEKVTPLLRAEGGFIKLIDVSEDGRVFVGMGGACAGCPFRQLTIKGFVERLVKQEVPEVREVQVLA